MELSVLKILFSHVDSESLALFSLPRVKIKISKWKPFLRHFREVLRRLTLAAELRSSIWLRVVIAEGIAFQKAKDYTSRISMIEIDKPRTDLLDSHAKTVFPSPTRHSRRGPIAHT